MSNANAMLNILINYMEGLGIEVNKPEVTTEEKEYDFDPVEIQEEDFEEGW